jgi:predicted transcriptional regulator
MQATTGFHPQVKPKDSDALSRAVQSALRGLTSVFGMGTGGVDPAQVTAARLERYLWTAPGSLSKLAIMEVHLRPEIEPRIQELAARTGRAPNDLIEDAMAGYLQELSQVREMLDNRYDDLKSGRVKPLDGEEAFAKLRRKSEERRARS